MVLGGSVGTEIELREGDGESCLHCVLAISFLGICEREYASSLALASEIYAGLVGVPH